MIVFQGVKWVHHHISNDLLIKTEPSTFKVRTDFLTNILKDRIIEIIPPLRLYGKSQLFQSIDNMLTHKAYRLGILTQHKMDSNSAPGPSSQHPLKLKGETNTMVNLTNTNPINYK
ncbi:hypothetical protein MS3_00000558 [Schistosoma haematobium]|uniref:Uncharacterized protein n=1 Tax=Schistosoma haematobium TaxID=6185 RepID=A0A922LER1_SCHHA|nr:hypothetical protein MS3_00000558 [Schistosoma haematobium]KAH9581050.1 hypothetical protein MS3_00000558 [Schistosoma haematobium]